MQARKGIEETDIFENGGAHIGDEQAETRPKTTGLIERMDEKAGEQIILRKGTLWAIGTLILITPILVSLVFNLVTGAREYQQVVNRVDNMEQRLKELENLGKEVTNVRIDMVQVKAGVESLKEASSTAADERKETAKFISDLRTVMIRKRLEE